MVPSDGEAVPLEKTVDPSRGPRVPPKESLTEESLLAPLGLAPSGPLRYVLRLYSSK